MPGAMNPLSAKLIERKGFDGVYISGAVLAAELGLPDIGLTTLTEVATRAEQIARVTELPALVDADTGFGGPIKWHALYRRSKTRDLLAVISKTKSIRNGVVILMGKTWLTNTPP